MNLSDEAAKAWGTKRLKVYVAGPFTAKDFEGIMHNLDNAIAAGNAVIERGHHPYVPHLTYYLAASQSNPFGKGLEGQNDRRWIDVDAPWVLACDAIYIMPSAYQLYSQLSPEATEIIDYPGLGKVGIVWKSKGAMHEYHASVERGMVVYWRLSDLPKMPEWEGAH